MRKTNWGGAALLAGALLALLLAIAIFRSDQATYAAMTARSDHFKAITDQTATSLSNLKDAESGQRGYLLTGNASYLEPYLVGVRGYQQSNRILIDLTHGETFAPLADDFIKAGSKKLMELDRVITLYNNGDRAAAVAIVDAGIGKVLMDAARDRAARVVANSESAFAINNRAITVAVQRSRYRLFFAAAVLFCLTLGGATLLTIEVRRETALAQGLEISEKRYRELAASLEEQVKERTQHLETVNKALDAFSYSVSHDLRAPLRAIDGFSLMVLEDYSDRLDDAGRDMLNRIRAAAARMGKLIQSLLHMSRLSAGELHRERISVSALARSLAEDLHNSSPDRKSEIQIAPGLAATSDPVLVGVILENLLSNAWKFSSGREIARIEVGAANVGGQMTFFVRDNGAGFDPELADRLFVPFQRLHANAEFEGMGIGLATVQRAVIRLGGRIWAEGQPGAGATFFFTLG